MNDHAHEIDPMDLSPDEFLQYARSMKNKLRASIQRLAEAIEIAEKSLAERKMAKCVDKSDKSE